MSNNPRYDAETIDLFAIELGLQPASSEFTPNMPALMALQEMKARLTKLLDLWAVVEKTSFINTDGSTADWSRAYMNFEREIREQLQRRPPPELCPECKTTFCNRALAGRCGYPISFARFVASHTKHGPGGTGAKGPCDVDCVKCRAEAEVAKARP